MSVKASSVPHVCTGTHKGPAPEDGNIQLILGPMFSGKSTELLRRLRRYMQHQKCLLIAYKVHTIR
jgi:thymidine kinase